MTRQHIAKPTLRQQILDYLAAHSGSEINMHHMADRLNLTYHTVVYQVRCCRMDGLVDYHRNENGITIDRINAIPNLGQPCVRCGILTHHRDRAGYCGECAGQDALGHPVHYWHRTRVIVQGLPQPEPADQWTP